MSLTISAHTEALLIEEARKQGLSVDALLEKLINERVEAPGPQRPAQDLPLWPVGVIGSLHRRDIYNDVA
jgi:hypothetical protein